MKLQEFYESIGANYETVLNRLPNEKLIFKYLNLFCKDPTFNDLNEAIQVKDKEVAFRSAHTLKGLALNLELTSILPAVKQLTETLRNSEVNDQTIQEFEELSVAYEQLKEKISNISEESL